MSSGGEEWILLARLRRPQGRAGELIADLLTDFPEKFAQRRRVFLLRTPAGADAEERTLESHWLHRGGVVLGFAGITSISAAEQLRDRWVAIPRAERAELGPDTFYIGDLIGCAVHLAALPGAPLLGTVASVDRESTEVPLLVVAAGDGAEVLVPFVRAYLEGLDLEGRRLDMRLPEGLVELNAADSKSDRKC